MSNAITIESAVARMVNIESIPAGSNLMDYLDKLASEAEDDYEKAKNDGLNHEELQMLELCVQASDLRYKLAGTLKLHMEWELETASKSAILKPSSDISNEKTVELDSVDQWAKFFYRIGRFNFEELNNAAREKPTNQAEINAIEINKKGLSGALATRLYITFAYLLEGFVEAKNAPKEFGTPQKIKVSKVADYLLALVRKFRKSDQFYNVEILKDRIEISLAMKRLFGEK
jgi:hypothetical protein